jgi:hypothetical protein
MLRTTVPATVRGIPGVVSSGDGAGVETGSGELLTTSSSSGGFHAAGGFETTVSLLGGCQPAGELITSSVSGAVNAMIIFYEAIALSNRSIDRHCSVNRIVAAK